MYIYTGYIQESFNILYRTACIEPIDLVYRSILSHFTCIH